MICVMIFYMLNKDIEASAKETKKWLRHLNWKKIIFVGLLYTIFATIIRQIEVLLTIQYYLLPEYYGVWSKWMMPIGSPPSSTFIILSLILTFYPGISLALIYCYVKDLLPKKFWNRVFFFADLMISASFIFFTLPAWLLFNLPWQLLVSWFISGFLILVLTSLTLVKIID
jgi:hypothetical protein